MLQSISGSLFAGLVLCQQLQNGISVESLLPNLKALALLLDVGRNDAQTHRLLALPVLQRLLQKNAEQLILIHEIEQIFEKTDRLTVQRLHLRIARWLRPFVSAGRSSESEHVGAAGLVVFLDQFLSLHAAEVVLGGNGKRQLPVQLVESYLELEVLDLLLLARRTNVGEDALRGEIDAVDRMTLSEVNMHHHVFETDVGALLDLVVRLVVRLLVVDGCGELHLVGVLEGQRRFAGDEQEERGALERCSLEEGQDVGVDESGNARELHLYLIYIARPKTFKSQHSPTPQPSISLTPYTHLRALNSLNILFS